MSIRLWSIQIIFRITGHQLGVSKSLLYRSLPKTHAIARIMQFILFTSAKVDPP